MIRDARRAREEAAVARSTALALRLDTRRSARSTEEALIVAWAQARRLRARRELGYASPWSDLRWSWQRHELDHVLEGL